MGSLKDGLSKKFGLTDIVIFPAGINTKVLAF
jgi:hypothetical protein